MSFWLKAAEDLFEVVDRKAKLVADEQTHSVLPASSGQDAQDRSIKSKDNRKPSNSQPPKVKAPEFDRSNVEMPPAVVPSDKNDSRPVDKVEEISPDATVGASEDPPHTPKDATTPNDVSTTGSAPVGREDGSNNVMDISEVGPIISSFINDPGAGKFDGLLEIPTSAPSIDQAETVPVDLPVYEEDKSENTSLSVSDVKSESGSLEVNNVKTNQGNNLDSLPETKPLVKMANDNVNDTAPAGVQDQLNEAQGLLKTAVSIGQSKEARLARVCAGLSSRLQEYKSENAQLEELLVAERELSSSYQACIKQLEKDISTRRGEAAIVESSMADALAAKNAEIEALSNSVETFKRRASESEEKLLSLQENMDTIMRSRELTETRMMQALKEELASAERRAEEERSAHNATKMAAVDREVELEHRAVEASNALAITQRAAEESSSRAMDLEHKLALLEVECATLNQELQEMEARARRGLKKSSEESNQVLQIQAWQEEVERARQGQRDAESKLSSLEVEMQKMRVEMAGMRRDAEHYSRHEHMELEKRYRELTDLLYHKQTQLETMASEKAAIEFHLEKEIKRHQEAQVEAERSRSSRRASSTWEEDADLKTLETLPLHHRHMAAASIQLERAAKFVDSGAVRATRFLWRYPYARVILLFYLEQADSFAAREVAASMGLNSSRLP